MYKLVMMGIVASARTLCEMQLGTHDNFLFGNYNMFNNIVLDQIIL